jgi:hypothetical protein
MHTKFLFERLKERDHLEDLMHKQDNNKVEPKEICWKGVDWIQLAQERGQWPARCSLSCNKVQSNLISVNLGCYVELMRFFINGYWAVRAKRACLHTHTHTHIHRKREREGQG